jgi:hypothetical protein
MRWSDDRKLTDLLFQDAGSVALETPSDRFHWLTAPRSAVVQTSAVNAGRSLDPAAELDRLFREQVGEQA